MWFVRDESVIVMPHDDTVSPNNESVVARSDLAHGTRFVDDERVIVIPDDWPIR